MCRLVWPGWTGPPTKLAAVRPQSPETYGKETNASLCIRPGRHSKRRSALGVKLRFRKLGALIPSFYFLAEVEPL